jgi:hypothetical protein
MKGLDDDIGRIKGWGWAGENGYLSDLCDLLITREIVEIARVSLSSVEKAEKIDLLTILQGRLLQFQENNMFGQEVEAEGQLLARAALKELGALGNDEYVREAALDVLAVLPARTKAEIALIWGILDETQNKQIQEVCADVLLNAESIDEAAERELEKGKSSPVNVIREIVEKKMENRKRLGRGADDSWRYQRMPKSK